MANKHKIKAALNRNEELRKIDLDTGYEYYVSNLGNVFVNKGGLYEVGAYINNCGYVCVNLRINNTYKVIPVHRLVATAFIPNLDNLSDVNHKNECKLDNRVENLEWVTHKENMRYSMSKGVDNDVRQMIDVYGLCLSILYNARDTELKYKTRTVYAYDTNTHKQKKV